MPVIYARGCGISGNTLMVDIAANCRMIFERIGRAAARCGRDAGAVKLLAASKSQSAEKIRAAAAAGVQLFGENYVQEAAAKKAAISGPVEWHLIGHLQRNKAKAALDLVDVIESLDSIELARALDKEAGARGRVVRALIEINLGGEASKSGVAAERLTALLEAIAKLRHVKVEGLMAVPPFSEDAEKARRYFKALRDLRDKGKTVKAANIDLKELSMGMSQDFEVAIEEGATLVRVGTALFGPRER
jgi:PLP dependent protein